MNSVEGRSNFARRVFLAAGIFGLIVVTPLYFLEEEVAKQTPPAITHPEFFYGFAGVTLVWQLVYLLVASDPARYRPLMLLGALAKGSYGSATGILYAQHRLAASTFAFSVVDWIFAGLFVLCYARTREGSGQRAPREVV